jgi:enoyl-[acyl-carrier protein] reductase II
MLALKKHVPVRLFKNKFFEEIKELEDKGASSQELMSHLGKGRAKNGMLEGDLSAGELEIGQGCSLIQDIPTTQVLVSRIMEEYKKIQLPHF